MPRVGVGDWVKAMGGPVKDDEGRRPVPKPKVMWRDVASPGGMDTPVAFLLAAPAEFEAPATRLGNPIPSPLADAAMPLEIRFVFSGRRRNTGLTILLSSQPTANRAAALVVA